MCGICGFISRRDIRLDQLKGMNDTMLHRGPDDSGEEIYPLGDGYALGLAQRRLSIFDLSQLGHQPMHSENRRVSVVYNGEIYNYLELKKELGEYPFRSACDTEVIIAAYLKWGIDFVQKINGMFAIALWDRETENFYLLRDRIGKKPLYYQVAEGDFYFASELKPLMVRPGFQKKIHKGVIARYLYQQYICHPDSVFEGVCKLEPGAVLCCHLGGELKAGNGFPIEVRKYWDVSKVYGEMRKHPVKDYRQAKSELKELLKKAVTSRMAADVPSGAFLSGGYDSSLITAMAVEHAAKPVKTFSIGFHEESYNEAKYAKAIADYLGTDHTEAYISEQEMFALVESIPRYYDEPFADSSQIPTMLVSALARRDVTVALSGDGGDEFFCGYHLYEKVRQAQLLDLPGGLLHGICGLPGLKNLHLKEKLPFPVRVVAENRSRETKVQFGTGSYLEIAEKMVRGEKDNGSYETFAEAFPMLPCNYPIESRYTARSWQVRRMLLDMDTYLPGDILCKVDRASMKYSLETRCPILDKEVMEYSFRMDHGYKYQAGVKKKILKDIAWDYLPKELLERPKAGFRVPLDQWLRGPLKEQLLDLCNKEFLKRQGIFHGDYMASMVKHYLHTGDGGPFSGANYSKLIWSFFVFQQWYQTYLSSFAVADQ